MTTFLLLVSLPLEHVALVERLVKSAGCFLATTGSADAKTLASGERLAGKGRSREHVSLLSLAVSTADGADARARRLEGVLRETLVDANVSHGDVRVFVTAAVEP